MLEELKGEGEKYMARRAGRKRRVGEGTNGGGGDGYFRGLKPPRAMVGPPEGTSRGRKID